MNHNTLNLKPPGITTRVWDAIRTIIFNYAITSRCIYNRYMSHNNRAKHNQINLEIKPPFPNYCGQITSPNPVMTCLTVCRASRLWIPVLPNVNVPLLHFPSRVQRQRYDTYAECPNAERYAKRPMQTPTASKKKPRKAVRPQSAISAGFIPCTQAHVQPTTCRRPISCAAFSRCLANRRSQLPNAWPL